MIGGGIILALSFGVRSIFGGIVVPLSDDLFDGRIEVFSLSIAIQNLVWGLTQPLFGMMADRYGDRRALWCGFLFYVAGMGLCIAGTSPLVQHLGAGVMIGMGISGTAFGIILAVVGRNAPAEKRDMYLGITSAIGSSGQVMIPLLAAWLNGWMSWQFTLLIFTALLFVMMLCIPMMRSPNHYAETPVESNGTRGASYSFKDTMAQAFRHPSYLFLIAGFFVCGFHLAFISTHLPNFVQHFCTGTAMSAQELRAYGLQALSLVGFANIFGTLLVSYLGTRIPKPYVLSAIYALRSVAIILFILQPITPASIMIFAFAMGILWLSTVPLTSALVLTMFGPKTLGTLFGFVFLSHQLGSFTGVWLAGILFDIYGNYDLIWHASIVLGFFSAAVHLMVRERPAPGKIALA
jgi:MFS family permease